MARYLCHSEARELADAIETAVGRVRLEFRNKSADPKGLEHEIALTLARAAVRYGFDILPPMAVASIERLEVAVAELAGKIEQYRETFIEPIKMPSSSHADRAIRESTPKIDPEIYVERKRRPTNGR